MEHLLSPADKNEKQNKPIKYHKQSRNMLKQKKKFKNIW